MKSRNWPLICVAMTVLSTSGFAKSKSDIRDVTGCLSKGNSTDAFVLNGDDGSMWDVKSSRVNLGKHVGHTVTLTGVVSNAMMHNMKEDAKDAAKDTGATKSNTEHGHLKVTNVKMVEEQVRYKPPETPAAVAAKCSSLGRAYMNWARFPITETEPLESGGRGYVVRFKDLRFELAGRREDYSPWAVVRLSPDLRVADMRFGNSQQ